MEGYEDPMNRGTYPWGHEDLKLREWFVRLGELRKRQLSLQKGNLQWILAEGHVLVFARKWEDEATIAAINVGSETAEIKIKWPRKYALSVLSGKKIETIEGEVTIIIQPEEGVIVV